MNYISKRFLSDDVDETGSMVVRVQTTPLEDMGQWSADNNWVQAELTFRDCHNKPIYLQFCLDKQHTLEARLDKVDLIITELEGLKSKLIAASIEQQLISKEWKKAQNPEVVTRNDGNEDL